VVALCQAASAPGRSERWGPIDLVTQADLTDTVKRDLLEVSAMLAHAHRGFGLIEIMVVVVILMIMVGGYSHFGGFGDGVDQGTAQMAMDRANDTACQMSRAAAAGNVEMWLVSHPGQTPTTASLRESGISMRCPHSRSGGTYVYIDGEVYCTDHYPPPAAQPRSYTSAPTPIPRSSSLGSGSGSRRSHTPAPTQGNPVWDALGRRPAMP
jgi:prepilin-type N-terminal cleavage/methylation domain-containing protein